MRVPPANDPLWTEIVTGKARCDFEFLAIKILLGTLGRTWAKNPSPVILRECANELREFFAQNADLPSVRNDLKRLFG